MVLSERALEGEFVAMGLREIALKSQARIEVEKLE
jgi:hypothetical protein